MKYICLRLQNMVAKIFNERLFVKSAISAGFSSLAGTLLVLIYLLWGKDDTYATDVSFLIFFYALVAGTSLTGTLLGSLIVGMPVAALAQRFYPDAPVKGGLFIVCFTLFIWLALLAWPVIGIFKIHYSDILLLSPYVFCSAAALAYQVLRK